MPDFTTDELTWDQSSDLWIARLAQSPLDIDNIGIASNPYVYRIYVSGGLLSSLKGDLESSEGESGRHATLLSALQDRATYIRPARADDMGLPTLSSLTDTLLTKIDLDWYQGVTYDRHTVNPQDSSDSTATSEQVFAHSHPDGYEYIHRSAATEHLPLAGYYTFRVPEMYAASQYFDFASRASKLAKHYLLWKTKAANAEQAQYTPISVSILSTNPSREFLPGSRVVSEAAAGDSITLKVSGGSGEFTVVPSLPSAVSGSLLEWRVVENATQTIRLTVSDSNIANESTEATINVTERS